MCRTRTLPALILGLAVIAVVAVGSGCGTAGDLPPSTPSVKSVTSLAAASPVSPATEVAALLTDSPLPTPTQTAIPVDWSDVGPPPTPEPTPTVLPFPTLVPTPVVTPIPVAQPPFIPGLETLTPSLDRVFIREGDRIFLMSEDGRSRRLLVDTAVVAGLYIRHYPHRETEGPRLEWGSVSPDGSTVALTVTDVWDFERGQTFAWHWQVYLLDVASGRLTYLVDGRNPVWAPDSRRVALIGGGGVSVADAASGESALLLRLEVEEYVSEVAWSPDGARIACVRQSNLMGGDSSLLILDAQGARDPAVLRPRSGYAPVYGLAWLADSESVVFARTDYDNAMASYSQDLWQLNVTTLEERRLTSNAAVYWISASPVDPRWMAFIGDYPFERPEFPPGLGMALYSIWLVDTETDTTTRLTSPLGGIRALSWSPDGTRLYFQRMEGRELWSLDLATGLLYTVVPTEIDFSVAR